MNFIKKQNIFSWLLILSAIFGVVSFIIYLANSTTGFMAGQPVNPAIIILTLASIIGCVALFLVKGLIPKRLSNIVIGICEILIGVCLALSFCLFTTDRLSVIADVKFIPVNYPEAENATFAGTVVCLVTYGLAIISLVAASIGSLTKEEADPKLETAK